MELLSGREVFQVILLFLRTDPAGIQLEAIKKEENKSDLYQKSKSQDNIPYWQSLIQFSKRGGIAFM